MKYHPRSTVHRSVHLDVISVQKLNAKGKVIGEHRFVGLFTSIAYNTRPADIPLLRQKVTQISALAGLKPSSHDHKALENVLETYPRDDFFQADVSELCQIALGIVYLQGGRMMICRYATMPIYWWKISRWFSAVICLARWF